MLLISRHKSAPRQIKGLIASAFDYIVVLDRTPRPMVREITLVKDIKDDNFVLETMEI